MRYQYETWNTCSVMIEFDLEGAVVSKVNFIGGCSGNQQAIQKLVEGLTVEQIEETCGGILCGSRLTSCPDQLAKAVRMAYEESQPTPDLPGGNIESEELKKPENHADPDLENTIQENKLKIEKAPEIL